MHINIIYDDFNEIDIDYDRGIPISLKTVRKNTNNKKNRDTSITSLTLINNNTSYKTSCV